MRTTGTFANRSLVLCTVKSTLSAAILGLAIAASAVARISESYALFVEPKVGEVQLVRVKAELDIGGMKVNLESTQRKTTEAVEPGVAFKQKITIERIKLVIDGEDVVAETPDHTMISNADGSFRGSLEPFNDIYSYKNSLLTVIHLSPVPRAVGDKWTETRPGDSELGTATVKQSFEFVEVEEIGGAPCAKIEFVAEESSEKAGRHKGTLWVNLRTKEKVKGSGEYYNVPWSGSPMLANGKYEIELVNPEVESAGLSFVTKM